MSRNEGYDDLLDAIEADEGYYLKCPNDHGSLPPRRVCPHCGARELIDYPIPEVGTVVTYTVVSVPAPTFEADAPYVTAIVDFGDVRLTGIVDAEAKTVETGMTVGLAIGTSVTTGERSIQFLPR